MATSFAPFHGLAPFGRPVECLGPVGLSTAWRAASHQNDLPDFEASCINLLEIEEMRQGTIRAAGGGGFERSRTANKVRPGWGSRGVAVGWGRLGLGSGLLLRLGRPGHA